MNCLGKYFFRRRPVRSVLFICLLSLLSTLVFLGVSQYLLSQEQFELIDRLNYTTVKLDDSNFAATTTIHPTFTSDKTFPPDWSALTYKPGLEDRLKSFHENSEEVLLYDQRMGLTLLFDTLHRIPEHSDMSVERVLSVPDLDTAEMTFSEYLEHQQLLDELKPLQFRSAVQGIVSARCLKIEYHTYEWTILDFEAQEFVPVTALSYVCYFEIDHSQSQLSAVCDDMRYMKLLCFCLDENFRPFFEEGHDYKIATSGKVDFSFPRDHYDAETRDIYDKERSYLGPWGVLPVDSEPQYYLDCTLFGSDSYDLRFNLQESQLAERDVLRREHLQLQKIPEKVKANLPWDLSEDKRYAVDIYGSESGPVWDLSHDLTVAQLAENEDLFADYDKYISVNSRTFQAVLCLDPLLFPDFSAGNLYLEDKEATLARLETVDGSACIIPVQLAEYYDIKPGDKITAAVAHTGYSIRQSTGDEREIAGEIFDPYTTETKLPTSLQELDYLEQAEQYEFTVVGCFNYKSKLDLSKGVSIGVKEVSNGDKYFSLYENLSGGGNVIDTIFVLDRGEGFDELAFLMPQTSEFGNFVSNKTNMLSVRLKNGSANVAKYLSDIEEAGLEEYVLKVDDHGYAKIEPVLQDMKRESISQLIIFLGSAVVVLVFYFFMLSRFYRSDLERMFVLGTEQRIIRGSIFSVLGRYWLSAAIMTAVISAVLLPQLERNLQQQLQEINQLDQSVLLNKLPLLLIVFALLMLASLLLSYLYSRQMAKTVQA